VLIREAARFPSWTSSRKSSVQDTLLLDLALPDDNAHSPNEKFDLDLFANGPAHQRAAVAGIGLVSVMRQM